MEYSISINHWRHLEAWEICLKAVIILQQLWVEVFLEINSCGREIHKFNHKMTRKKVQQLWKKTCLKCTKNVRKSCCNRNQMSFWLITTDQALISKLNCLRNAKNLLNKNTWLCLKAAWVKKLFRRKLGKYRLRIGRGWRNI